MNINKHIIDQRIRKIVQEKPEWFEDNPRRTEIQEVSERIFQQRSQALERISPLSSRVLRHFVDFAAIPASMFVAAGIAFVANFRSRSRTQSA